MAIRKPRIAIMGEFSSGKSTLCNLLMGARPLLEKVTATQLPPVMVSYGNAPAYRVDLDGGHHPLEVSDLAYVDLEDTRLVHIFLESDVLQMCDLIDMPGISDPNMSSEVWERVVHLADGMLWCTHATQAWRQSEAGVWASLPPSLYGNSLLLITRFDKIVNDSDRLRVLRRVATETEGLFAGFFPVSLTAALAAGDDGALWVESGAHAFVEALLEIVQRLSESDLPADDLAAPHVSREKKHDLDVLDFAEPAQVPTNASVEPAEAEFDHSSQPAFPFTETDRISRDGSAPVRSAVDSPAPTTALRVVPRRVMSKNGGTPRPRGGDNIVYLNEQLKQVPEERLSDFQLRSVFT
ncbi:MAG: dynamin family protein [Paracoccaceae bacterium]